MVLLCFITRYPGYLKHSFFFCCCCSGRYRYTAAVTVSKQYSSPSTCYVLLQLQSIYLCCSQYSALSTAVCTVTGVLRLLLYCCVLSQVLHWFVNLHCSFELFLSSQTINQRRDCRLPFYLSRASLIPGTYHTYTPVKSR